MMEREAHGIVCKGLGKERWDGTRVIAQYCVEFSGFPFLADFVSCL